MPTTPGGYKPLSVLKEVTAITQHSEFLGSITHLQHPQKDSVLATLKHCTVAHFACHGTGDQVEPTKSALIVGKDREERLTVSDLDALVHQGAQIAYLSACSTAEIKTLNLADEAIHLASTFQLAGFRHVVGTLWGADDKAAVGIASRFYEELLKGGGLSGGNSVAHALHNAVVYFRGKEDNWNQVYKWAPFIHLGA